MYIYIIYIYIYLYIYIYINDRTENVLELRRGESYWQHSLDTFIPNGMNEHFVGIPIL